jgi:beta-glucanase (GH16 family)
MADRDQTVERASVQGPIRKKMRSARASDPQSSSSMMALKAFALAGVFSTLAFGCSSSQGKSQQPGNGTGGAPAGGSGAAQSAAAGQPGGSGATSTGATGGTAAAANSGASGSAATAQIGGAGTTGHAGGGPDSGGTDPFVLAWQDDFDTLDSSAWQLQTFTYDGNEATFSTQNASVADGLLTISLTAASAGAAKPYLGVEMRSAKTLTYGKVSARMRFASGSGVVSGLVLFYTPYPNCDWNEIDIEHLGKSSNSSQLNAQVYTGTSDPNCTTSVTPTQDPQVVDLGFNAEADFHIYDIEWTPAGVKYFGDGVLLRTWSANIARLKLPETILLTIWASSSADWAGALMASSVPASAQVDWIKVYDYDAAAAGM